MNPGSRRSPAAAANPVAIAPLASMDGGGSRHRTRRPGSRRWSVAAAHVFAIASLVGFDRGSSRRCGRHVGRRRLPALPAAAITVGLGLLAGCGSGTVGSDSADGAPPGAGAARTGSATASALQACPQVGAPAAGDNVLPDLTLPCLGEGSAVALRRLTGVPTVLNLWASWCAPCRAELPSFEAVSRKARGRVRVLGVASEDARQRALAFAADTGIRFPSVVDDTGRLLRSIGRRTMPTTLFVDAAGQIVEVYNGQPLTGSDLRQKIKERLGVDVG